MVPWGKQQQVLLARSKQTSIGACNTSNRMAAPATARCSSPVLHSLNGPDSPPVVFSAGFANFDDEEDRCKHCHSPSMFTDWSQGDRVCTNCGVVAESRVRDSRAEWKDFNETEDLVKGLPSNARCGLVPVDESKYLGGLQPTTLSKEAFGGSGAGSSLHTIRKRLKTTNRKLDRIMEKKHQRALEDAKIDRKIRVKKQQQQHHSSYNHDDTTIRPELETLVLQEEEDAHRRQWALYSEKWSIDRAIFLFGNGQEAEFSTSPEEERDQLMERLDNTLRKASQDLYTAYSMLVQAAQSLHLPDRVRSEVVHRLQRYATRRNGLRVSGVSSRLSSNSASNRNDEEVLERLKEYNKVKQMASLGAAILFLTARSLGWTRTVVEICSCFEWGDDRDQQQQQQLIKPKHCSKAMKEIQASFPEYARAPTNSGPAQSNTRNSQDATANFAEHALRRLQLPPVAESSIRALLLHCREEQVKLGRNSGTKLSTLCASVTYFVCHAGSIMQRLAQQIPENQRPTTSTNTTTLSQSIATSSTLIGHKRALASDIPILRKKRKLIDLPTTRIIASIPTLGEINKVTGENQEAKARSNDSDDDDSSLDHLKPDDEEEPFDVFSHAPIMLDDEHCPEKQEYEMRRMWDAWREQMPWSRSISEIEQSCGVSRNSLNGFYKSELYPRRDILLAVLKDAVSMAKDRKKGGGVSLHPNNNNKEANSLQETPLAPILLMQVSTAAQLMSGK